ncbi:MAG: glycoside hydrolase family 16 protein, partial [Bacteroidetes bacterium]|nr:glycoside hydrolase family 16 protein [Bacteroidota bacterium]
LLSLTFCTNTDETINTDDPSNISLVILSLDLDSGELQIQSAAKNAVEYRLFISGSQTPDEINETGFFVYTLEEEGLYTCEVRAYGLSGKFVKATKQIEFSQNGNNPVPLEQGYFTPMEHEGYHLAWNDEFDGNTINSDYWSFNTGNGSGGWGNNELEYYRSENAWVADDVLTIEARKQSYGGKSYTSARMKTEAKFSFQYGRVDIRALLPKGQGIWPALWMLGENISSVGWPKCGEIDIMEMVGGSNSDNQVHGTIHYDNNGHIYTGDHITLSSGIFAEAYHVFTIIWDETNIRWYEDDALYYEIDITDPIMSEFHQNFWFIFNVAIGGNWPGNPISTTIFPQQMKVDYIRVFQED